MIHVDTHSSDEAMELRRGKHKAFSKCLIVQYPRPTTFRPVSKFAPGALRQYKAQEEFVRYMRKGQYMGHNLHSLFAQVNYLIKSVDALTKLLNTASALPLNAQTIDGTDDMMMSVPSIYVEALSADLESVRETLEKGLGE